MDEIQGNFPMRFIGKPGGKFMKGAPGSYTHGEVYVVPYSYSHFPYWELIGEKPELTVPEEEEGEFEEAFFMPDDEVEYTSTPSMGVPGLLSQDDYEKQIRSIEKGDFTVDPDGLIDYNVASKPLTRKQLKKKLDEAGVDYNPRTRTHNLKKLVDELDQEED